MVFYLKIYTIFFNQSYHFIFTFFVQNKFFFTMSKNRLVKNTIFYYLQIVRKIVTLLFCYLMQYN